MQIWSSRLGFWGMRRGRGAALEGGCLSHGGEAFQMPHYLIDAETASVEHEGP